MTANLGVVVGLERKKTNLISRLSEAEQAALAGVSNAAETPEEADAHGDECSNSSVE